jgi:hypothetical protein
VDIILTDLKADIVIEAARFWIKDWYSHKKHKNKIYRLVISMGYNE